MRYFNTAGPCDPERHYMIDPLARCPEAERYVERGDYFVLHAPRQTGKTTLLRELARVLTAKGRFAALYTTCEAAEPARDDYEAAQGAVLTEMGLQAALYLPAELRPPPPPAADPTSRLRVALSHWAATCPRPIALFLDEIDAIQGDSLLSVLRQLRAGFPTRPHGFPLSIALCGLRDVRDYKAASGGDPNRLGTSSPFNVKVSSIRVGDFDEGEVRELYGQHTADTGQVFTDEALSRVFELTQGQPWLVNALGREVTEEMGIPVTETLSAEHVEAAKERLILARQTHLDSLVARLQEDRVKRVLEPLMAGDSLGGDEYSDDQHYVRDLGLVAPDRPLRVANPIYREIMVRVLSAAVEDQVIVEPRAFVLEDGRLDLRGLLEAFGSFWNEHGDVLGRKMPYHEVAPQLVLMGFLQRVVNGGGFIDREYGVGRGRIDLLVRWPLDPFDSRTPTPRRWQEEAIELKVWRAGRPDPLGDGLRQLDDYLTRLGLDHGALVVFDRRGDRIPEPAFEEATSPTGRPVLVLRA